MTFKNTLDTVKQTQKDLAHEIREGRKNKQDMRYESVRFRYNHLAYCLVRGRSLRQIEHKNGDGNAPYRSEIIQAIKELFGLDVCEYCRPFISGSIDRLNNLDDFRIPKPAREVQHEEAVHACA